MRSIYDQEMRDIQRDSIHMCNLASETLQDVMDAVRRRDFTVVERVLEQDQRIRSMRMALNERVMRMIATQHPVAVPLHPAHAVWKGAAARGHLPHERAHRHHV